MTRERLAMLIATAFGIGHAPKAPGTFGSLPGLLMGYLIHLASPSWPVTALALTALVGVAYWSIATYEHVSGLHDDQRVVVDEVAGQAIAVAFLPPTLLWYASAFALFRLLDITKPPPIGTIDRRVKGAAGTLFDDVLAGAVAAAVLLLLSNRLS